jgi:hypothetical protein
MTDEEIAQDDAFRAWWKAKGYSAAYLAINTA